MKICKVTKDIYQFYEQYIPGRFAHAIDGNDYQIWGIYDAKGALGAAVLQFTDGIAELRSLRYDADIEEGVCEKLVTDLLVKGAKENQIDRVVYIAEGGEAQLKALDITMMELGYFPREGDVKLYTTTLGGILKSQEKYLVVLEKKLEHLPMCSGKEMSQRLIRQYNEMHWDVPYRAEELDPRISYFLLREDVPVACVMARENEQGEIVFVWMAYDAKVDRHTLLLMLHAQMLAAKKYYSEDTKVIVCPFTEEVEALVAAFGFEEDVSEGKMKTHIYTLYL